MNAQGGHLSLLQAQTDLPSLDDWTLIAPKHSVYERVSNVTRRTRKGQLLVCAKGDTPSNRHDSDSDGMVDLVSSSSDDEGAPPENNYMTETSTSESDDEISPEMWMEFDRIRARVTMERLLHAGESQGISDCRCTPKGRNAAGVASSV